MSELDELKKKILESQSKLLSIDNDITNIEIKWSENKELLKIHSRAGSPFWEEVKSRLEELLTAKANIKSELEDDNFKLQRLLREPQEEWIQSGFLLKLYSEGHLTIGNHRKIATDHNPDVDTENNCRNNFASISNDELDNDLMFEMDDIDQQSTQFSC